MHHMLIALALLTLVGLDLIFVSYSDTSAAALTFAVLSYVILLLLSVSAGGFAQPDEDHALIQGPLQDPGPVGLMLRALVAAFIPVVLLLVLALMSDLDDPFAPSEAVQLGSTFVVFWLLMSLTLVGVVLGFLWPRAGPSQAVIAGAVVVLVQGLLSWTIADASREAIQLALYTWMVWVSLCLVGAWAGLILRHISDLYLQQPGHGRLTADSGLTGDPGLTNSEAG